MPLLVTSAAGVNGDGYGALLAFDRNGSPLGAFSDDARIADPRGLAVDQKKELLFFSTAAAIECWRSIRTEQSYGTPDPSRN
jgi:hypothetical protein